MENEYRGKIDDFTIELRRIINYYTQYLEICEIENIIEDMHELPHLFVSIEE